MGLAKNGESGELLVESLEQMFNPFSKFKTKDEFNNRAPQNSYVNPSKFVDGLYYLIKSDRTESLEDIS
uniref:Uncharacterized protein n=1 Tax=Panagrolaimus sp. ES5 TaxID=591445 RepID=A0AC34GXS0_9BILA